MKCAKVKELLSEYIDGTLDEQIKVFVEKHLLTCKECAEEHTFLKAYVKELNALKRVGTPENFLESVHERIKGQPGFKRIINKLFRPMQIKVPLELAGVVVTVVLLFFVVKGLQTGRKITHISQVTDSLSNLEELKKEPVEIERRREIVRKEKELKEEPVGIVRRREIVKKESVKKAIISRKLEKPSPITKKKTAEVVAVSAKLSDKADDVASGLVESPPLIEEQKTIKLALLIKPEKTALTYERERDEGTGIDYFAEMEEEVLKRKGQIEKAPAEEFSTLLRDETKMPSSSLNQALFRVKDVIELAEGKVISVEYEKQTNLPQFINAEIPAQNYSTLLEKLNQFAELQKPLPSVVTKDKELIQIRIEFLSSK